MKLLVDMNLSPSWVEFLASAGFEAIHWSAVGDPREIDSIVMAWAKDRGYVVFSHDLDFGAILAATGAAAPSVIQVRTQDVTPEHLGPRLVRDLHRYREILDIGAIISVDEMRSRVRILPLT